MDLTVVDASQSVLPLMGQDWLDILYPGWREFFTSYKQLNKTENVSNDFVNNLPRFDVKTYKNQMCMKFKKVFSNDMFQPIKVSRRKLF